MKQSEHKYERLARVIRDSLGEPGSSLPSEAELMELYDEKRHTVRAALGALEAQGLITSSQGARRTVRKVKRWRWQMSAWEKAHRDSAADAWSHTIREQGGEPYNDIQLVTIEAPAEVAEALAIDEGTVIQARHRIRHVDGEPHQFSDSYFPPFVTEGSPLFHQPGDVAAPGGLLAASGYPQARFHDTLTARMPTSEEAQTLRMHAGTPLLVHTRVGYDADGRPLRYMATRMAADRVEITYDLDA